jgi:hypothetical protein
MPFDGSGYEARIEALDKMDKVIELLGSRGWLVQATAAVQRRAAMHPRRDDGGGRHSCAEGADPARGEKDYGPRPSPYRNLQ